MSTSWRKMSTAERDLVRFQLTSNHGPPVQTGFLSLWLHTVRTCSRHGLAWWPSNEGHKSLINMYNELRIDLVQSRALGDPRSDALISDNTYNFKWECNDWSPVPVNIQACKFSKLSISHSTVYNILSMHANTRLGWIFLKHTHGNNIRWMKELMHVWRWHLKRSVQAATHRNVMGLISAITGLNWKNL